MSGWVGGLKQLIIKTWNKFKFSYKMEGKVKKKKKSKKLNTSYVKNYPNGYNIMRINALIFFN